MKGSRTTMPAIFRKYGSGHMPFIAVLAVVHLVIYREYWLGSMVFNGSDLFQQVAPLINFQSDCMREFSWPFWNPFMNFGYPWIDNYVNSSLFPTQLVLGFFTHMTFMTVQRELLGWILLGGTGVYFCAIEFGASRRAALISGACFMFSGQLIALPTWNNNIYNAACFPFMILGYLRSRRLSSAISIMSIAFLTLAILGGNVASSILGIYFFSGFVFIDSLRRRAPLPGLAFIALTVGFAVLISSPKLLPLYRALGSSPRFDFSNQTASTNLGEIISFYNLMSCFLPVKYYFSLYIGEVGVIVLFHALLRKRLKIDTLLIMAVLSASLLMFDSEGNPSPVRTAADAILPFIRPLRQEFTSWHYPLFFVILYAAGHIDDYLKDPGRVRKISAVLLFNILLCIFFFSSFNTELYSRAFITQVIISLLWLVAGLLYLRPGFQTLLIPLLLTLELLAVFNRVGIDEPPLYGDGYMEITTKHQWHSSQSFMDAERFRESWRVRITRDELRPSVSDSRQRPYLIPLTPPGPPNPNWAEAMNMKLFVGWWYNTQERHEFISLMNDPGFLQLENRPLFEVVRLSSMSPIGVTSFDKISCSSFDFTVNTPEPGFFLLRQMYDDRWKVLVDGRGQKPVKADNYFMGVEVGAGSHKVMFRFRDHIFTISLFISGAAILILIMLQLSGVARASVRGGAAEEV